MTIALRLFAAALALAAASTRASEAYPSRTITIVAPGATGGTSDIFARLAANGLSRELGHPVIVENRGGAGTLIGTQHVAQAKPDGHTLLLGAAALTISPHVYAHMKVDPVRDLQPIRLMGRLPNVLVVNPASSAKTVAGLIALLHANPGAYNMASGGVGISEHLSGELFQAMTRTSVVHVPYKNSADSVMAVVTGDALMAFGNMTVSLPQVKAGKLRALAVTGTFRSSSLPDVPSVAEAGVADYDVTTWFGLLAPAGTPAHIVKTLDEAMQRVLASNEVRERLMALGAEPADEGPKLFADRIRTESGKWGPIVRKANIRPE